MCRNFGDPDLMLTLTFVSDWIVDYSPALLFKWAGHAHVHILKTLERPEFWPNAILYIVKYNFKDEPSFRVDRPV